MTLYEVLGVSPTATTAEITTAYKRLAMQKHPDRGGDVGEFQAIQKAHEVLTDAKKREHYDATGETESNQNHSSPVAILAVLFEQLINKDISDIVGTCRTVINNTMATARASIKEHEKRLAGIEKKRARITRESQECILSGVLDSLKSKAERALADNIKTQEDGEAMLVLLDEYEMEVDGDSEAVTQQTWFPSSWVTV